MALTQPKMLKMLINHHPVDFPEGVTVLRAAELNGIYIPSLCSHKDLSPFGSCRMCMVEIEGMRGYPLACDTRAQEGMKVLTDTVRLRELRKQILQLILSEHPSSCLICDEKDECKDYQGTIRKTGISTGCRYCPNDMQCELQDLVEHVGVTQMDYPVYYHGYEPEIEDPFYDRDYNICILCGRCVRMCQEVRGASVLAFTYRGRKAKIGPAFGRNHVEAGCEFCGACVDICPTGALADKVSKWDGKPDSYEISTCPFCAIGCNLEVMRKNGRLSSVKANLDPIVNDGQLCVKGRFCLPEITHHFTRARKPMMKKGAYFREVDWEEALNAAVEHLKDVDVSKFLLSVSPDLTNESLFAAQKFVREAMRSNSIDSTGRFSLTGGLDLWRKLFSLPISIHGIGNSDTIIALSLDTRFAYSTVGVEIRHALKRGARLITIDPRDSNLASYTNCSLRPSAGTEGAVIAALADAISGKELDITGLCKLSGIEATMLKSAIAIAQGADDLAVILGTQIFHYTHTSHLGRAIAMLADRPKTLFVPLYTGTNTRGAFELGVFSEFLPGPTASNGGGNHIHDLYKAVNGLDLLYLVGEAPFNRRPNAKYIISQDIYPPPFEVDLFLPAASFAEAKGTLTNIEGRLQRNIQIENLPDGARTGFSRPDWWILAKLAQRLGSNALRYESTDDVHADISSTIPGYPMHPDREARRLKPSSYTPPSHSQPVPVTTYKLVIQPGYFSHRSVDMSAKVEGLGVLALEEGLQMNSEDLKKLGGSSGSKVKISTASGICATVIAKSDPSIPRGCVYFTRPSAFGGLEHRADIAPLYAIHENPSPIEVSLAPNNGK